MDRLNTQYTRYDQDNSEESDFDPEELVRQTCQRKSAALCRNKRIPKATENQWCQHLQRRP